MSSIDEAPSAPERGPMPPMSAGGGTGCLGLLVTLVLTVILAVYLARIHLALTVLVVGVAAAITLGWIWRDKRREDAARERWQAWLRSVAPPEGAAWRALLPAVGLGHLVDRLTPEVLPALRLEPRRVDDLPIGASRLGGVPDLPPDMVWPHENGQPLPFVAQLDLAEVAAVLPGNSLPSAGHLCCFFTYHAYCEDRGRDGRETGVCIYVPAERELERRHAPSSLPDRYRFRMCALRLVHCEALPDLKYDPILRIDLHDLESDLYGECSEYLAKGGSNAASKLLGRADPLQSDLQGLCAWRQAGLQPTDASTVDPARREAIEASRSEWRLLLQVDGDDEARMYWGHDGRLFYWIHEKDLAAGIFDRVLMIADDY